jgi:hypothetical protein
MYFLLFLLDVEGFGSVTRTYGSGGPKTYRSGFGSATLSLRVLKGGEGLFSLLLGVGLEAALQAKVLCPAAHHCLQVLHS